MPMAALPDWPPTEVLIDSAHVTRIAAKPARTARQQAERGAPLKAISVSRRAEHLLNALPSVASSTPTAPMTAIVSAN